MTKLPNDKHIARTVAEQIAAEVRARAARASMGTSHGLHMKVKDGRIIYRRKSRIVE